MIKFFVVLLFLYIIFGCCNKNNEQFMSYDQKRKYFTCKYSGNPYHPSCRDFYSELGNIKQYIKNNPIGYVFNTNIRRPLSAWYDRNARQYYYYVIDHQGEKPNELRDDVILHKIENKGQMLSDGDTVTVPTRGQMTIRIYDDISNQFGSIYGNAFVDPLGHPRYDPSKIHPLNIPTYVSGWRTVGYLVVNNKYHKLYEKVYNRGEYKYRMQMYPGFFLDIINKNSGHRDIRLFKNKLYQGDVVQVDTMTGNHTVHIYNDLDINVV